MQIFDCKIHQITRGAALLFALYLMYEYRNNPKHPIFVGGLIMGGFDLYTWSKTECK